VGDCGVEETISHLFFFECLVFAGIWFVVCKWLEVSTTLQKKSLPHLDQYEGLAESGSVLYNKGGVIWFTCIWSIWKLTNENLFQNKDICLDNMVELVKRNSWNWLKLKSNSIDYNIAQWYLNLRACIG